MEVGTLKNIHFRVTENEYDKIKKRAQSVGMKLAPFVREMALQGWVMQRGVIEINRLIWEINKIGVNINQAVHLANQNEAISGQQLDYISEMYLDAINLLDKFIEPVKFLKGGDDIGNSEND